MSTWKALFTGPMQTELVCSSSALMYAIANREPRSRSHLPIRKIVEGEHETTTKLDQMVVGLVRMLPPLLLLLAACSNPFRIPCHSPRRPVTRAGPPAQTTQETDNQYKICPLRRHIRADRRHEKTHSYVA